MLPLNAFVYTNVSLPPPTSLSHSLAVLQCSPLQLSLPMALAGVTSSPQLI